MGNWRTVNIDGIISNQDEVNNIRADLLDSDTMFYLQFSDGLAAIGSWVPRVAGMKISVEGNLYERDCDLGELERELCVFAEKCPSANLVVNAGDDWESLTCVATFVVKDGACERIAPEVQTLREISETMMFQRMMKSLYG